MDDGGTFRTWKISPVCFALRGNQAETTMGKTIVTVRLPDPFLSPCEREPYSLVSTIAALRHQLPGPRMDR